MFHFEKAKIGKQGDCRKDKKANLLFLQLILICFRLKLGRREGIGGAAVPGRRTLGGHGGPPHQPVPKKTSLFNWSFKSMPAIWKLIILRVATAIFWLPTLKTNYSFAFRTYLKEIRKVFNTAYCTFHGDYIAHFASRPKLRLGTPWPARPSRLRQGPPSAAWVLSGFPSATWKPE